MVKPVVFLRKSEWEIKLCKLAYVKMSTFWLHDFLIYSLAGYRILIWKYFYLSEFQVPCFHCLLTSVLLFSNWMSMLFMISLFVFLSQVAFRIFTPILDILKFHSYKFSSDYFIFNYAAYSMSLFNLQTHHFHIWEIFLNYFLSNSLLSLFSVLSISVSLFCFFLSINLILDFLDCTLIFISNLFSVSFVFDSTVCKISSMLQTFPLSLKNVLFLFYSTCPCFMIQYLLLSDDNISVIT